MMRFITQCLVPEKRFHDWTGKVCALTVVSYTQLNSPREPVYEFNLERVFIDLFATGIQTIYLENEDSDDYVYHAKKKSYKNDTDSWKEVDSSIFKCCSQGSSQASLTPDAHLSHVHVVVVHVALRSDNRLMSIHLIHTGPGNNPDVHSVYSDYTSKNDCLCS